LAGRDSDLADAAHGEDRIVGRRGAVGLDRGIILLIRFMPRQIWSQAHRIEFGFGGDAF
jgi:hypothetical protein